MALLVRFYWHDLSDATGILQRFCWHHFTVVCKNLQMLNKSAKEEVERLQKLIKTRSNKIERLKNYLVGTLQALEVKKIETDLGSYGLRKNPKVDVYDISVLPEEFIRETIERKADKEKIKEYIKANGELQGARIVDGYSLQIR